VLNRTFILVVGLVAVLVVGAGGLYLYDFSREDEIAKGVSVNGVDLGGLSAAQARTKLRSSILSGMRSNVVVEAGRKSFRLSPRRARVSVNVDAMVNDAVSRSRDGNVLTRTWRALTGEEAKADHRPAITYSPRVVNKLIEKVEADDDRPARDASVVPTPSGLDKVRGRSGLTVRSRALRDAIVEELTNPTESRRVTADLIKSKPKVSTRDLARKYPTYLTVSKADTKLRLWKNLKLVKEYNVAVGMPAWPTPNGLFSIQDKTVDPTWSVPNSSWAGSLAGQVIPGGAPNNPLKARWMGFSNGAGIHGTEEVDSLGSAASHGCIRMLVPDVISLYRKVDVGTPIFIG
jgi:lipoprotein-anchoring transpeptidase ErfK/SrfK